MRRAMIFAVVLVASQPAGAAETALVPPDPWEVIHPAREIGTAEVERDSHEEPVIRGKIGELPYAVHFYGCGLGWSCEDLLFVARFPDVVPEKAGQLARQAAEWNRRKLFGRAVVDSDGIASVEMAMTLTGGTSPENMRAVFARWVSVVEEFSDFIRD